MTRTEIAADACLVLGYAALVAGLALVAAWLALVVGGLGLFAAGAFLTAYSGKDAATAPTPRKLGRRGRRHLAAVNADNPFNAETGRP